MKKIIHYIAQSIRPPVVLLLALLLIKSNVMAQDEERLGPAFDKIAKPQSTRGWIYFWENYKADPRTLFDDLRDAFKFSQDDKMMLIKTVKDDIGFTHYRYQQYYKNYQVVYGEYIVHQQPDGFVNVANGRLITGLKAGNIPTIAEKQALDAALQFMGARKYLWQNPELEKDLKRQQKNDKATYFPKGELVYAPDNFDETYKTSDYRLAWHFNIYTDDANVKAKSVYVDALTGKVIHFSDIAMDCSGATGTSAYNGSVSFSTEFSGSSYRSHNNCQATDLYVYNCNRGGASNTYYTDGDNSWTNQSAVQAQWGVLKTYQYYLNEHSRTSWNNAAGNMIAYNNAVYGNPPTANNACWGCTGNSAIFGAGTTTSATDDWNTDDIMGHEFTHGVTQSAAGLVYNKESGALNESFSDIFGEMVESYSEGNCDWLVGGDRGAIRSFINPNAYGDPDTYLGTNWYSTSGCTPSSTNDNCGVHTNSSVQNRWFYLLANGGSGVNDLGKSYDVTGIDRFDARQIAYRALEVYLTSSSKYIDSRKATLQAAYDIFGGCSTEIIAVGDAWHAVGVESQSPAYSFNVCGSYPASGTFEQAISVLTASSTGCITEITPSSSTVYFTARDLVVLYPGFIADAGSNFIAYLEPCSSTRWRTGRPESPKSEEEKRSQTHPAVTGNTQSPEEADAMNAAKGLAAGGISVGPNPFTSNIMISVNAERDGKANVSVYNAVGKKLKEQTGIAISEGFNKITFNGADLSQGIYMLEIYVDGNKTVKKVVKL